MNSSARAPILALALVLMSDAECRSESPGIIFQVTAGSFRVEKLSPQIAAQLRSLADDARTFRDVCPITIAGGDGTPILGTYRTTESAGQFVLVFEPRFPLAAGATYRVAFDPTKLPRTVGERIEKSFTMPTAPKPAAATVVGVYPSADQVPENLLRIYLHFSEPMRRGEAYDHIRVLDAAGKPVATPFVTFGEELWDESGKRLTLFFDPGRVKSGLKPREEAGPVLETGKKYTLVVDTGWRDASGQPLAREFRKPISVTAPVTAGIEPKEWKIERPTSGSSSPLIIRFPRPLDHGLLQHTLSIVDSNGKPIDGEVVVEAGETVWRLKPQAVWKAGTYALVLNPILEDIAGNRLGRPFEIDVKRAAQPEIPVARLEFIVK